MSKTVKFSVKRQDEPSSKPYLDEFEVPYEDGMNVTTLLMATRQFPSTCDGKATTPVSFESACLEEVCGSGRPAFSTH
jgi:succinate dehydrogenase / fumarate reductase iron-sulfur subunit